MHLQTENSLFGDAFLLVNDLLDNGEQFDDYLLHLRLGILADCVACGRRVGEGLTQL
jgi:hypothetical protein